MFFVRQLVVGVTRRAAIGAMNLEFGRAVTKRRRCRQVPRHGPAGCETHAGELVVGFDPTRIMQAVYCRDRIDPFDAESLRRVADLTDQHTLVARFR